MHQLWTARSLNWLSIWYMTVLLQHISTFTGIAIAMEPWQQIMLSLRTSHSLNWFSIWYRTVLLQHSDIYGNTYCNGTFTAKNALPLNSTFTQMILNLLYDSDTAAYIFIYMRTYSNGTLTANNALTLNSIGWTKLFWSSKKSNTTDSFCLHKNSSVWLGEWRQGWSLSKLVCELFTKNSQIPKTGKTNWTSNIAKLSFKSCWKVRITQ